MPQRGKPMKLQEADKLIAEMFPGECRAVTYRLATFGDGATITECGVYALSKGWHYAPTFRAALDMLMRTNEEIPEVDI
jgi:hypothetical protein